MSLMFYSHKISKSDSSGGEPVICAPYVHSLISGAMSALPDNQSPGNRWHFTWGTTLLHTCSAVKNLYVKCNMLIAEIFVLVKISHSSVRELSCGINVRTARTVSHTLLYVHGFRTLLNFVLSVEGANSTKLTRVRKVLRLQCYRWKFGAPGGTDISSLLKLLCHTSLYMLIL